MDIDILASGLATAYFAATFAFAAYAVRRLGEMDHRWLALQTEVENLKRVDDPLEHRGHAVRAKAAPRRSRNG